MRKILFFGLIILIVSCQQTKNKEVKQSNLDNKAYDIAWDFYEKQKNDSAYIYFNKAYSELIKNKNKHQAAKCLINMAFVSKDQGDWFGSQELIISSIKLLNPRIKDESVIFPKNRNV